MVLFGKISPWNMICEGFFVISRFGLQKLKGKRFNMVLLQKLEKDLGTKVGGLERSNFMREPCILGSR